MPNLDDRTFEELRADAIEFVRNRDGAWNDLGDGDPGTLLLEAFAYLTDMLIFRLNRVPNKARREFLELMGVQIRPPAAAYTELRFERPEEDTRGEVTIPAGTQVRADDSASRTPIVFTTTTSGTIEAGETSTSIMAYNCETIAGELLGSSNGEPDQQFRLRAAPAVKAADDRSDLFIGVELDDSQMADRPEAISFDGRGYELWELVESFAGLDPTVKAVRVDPTSGLVSFAPAVRRPTDHGVEEHPVSLAAIPAAGRSIRAWYRRGGGSSGNVQAHTLATIDGQGRSLPDNISVTNPGRASGGSDGETTAEAMRRGPEMFHEPRRAITADDFEALATAQPGVARVRATTEAEHWAHAKPGTVELRLVPDIGGAASPSVGQLVDAENPELLERVSRNLRARQPIGVQSTVRWAQYKEVNVGVRIVVARSENPEAVRARVLDRLKRTIRPTPTGQGDGGWPFGQALRASNVYNAVLKEPGVRYADNIEMEVAACPDGYVASLAADNFQADTWYAAEGATLFRSENGGLGWEAIHRFRAGAITHIEPANDRPGHVAVAVLDEASNSSRVFVSMDCGSQWSEDPVAAFSWPDEDSGHEVLDLAWMPSDNDDDLLLATERGLYRLNIERKTPRAWAVIPDEPERGCWAVAVSAPTGQPTEVAVCLQQRGGVWLAGSGVEDGFRLTGLDGADVRRLVVERRNIRSFLWAPTFAVGDEEGDGCYRSELRGTDQLAIEWHHLGTGWNGGICHDVSFLGNMVLGASERNGVLTLDLGDQEPAWRAPSVSCGLPLLESRRFETVRVLDAANGVALAGTGKSIHRTEDGEEFQDAAARKTEKLVTIPAAWLFVSGAHSVTVELER